MSKKTITVGEWTVTVDDADSLTGKRGRGPSQYAPLWKSMKVGSSVMMTPQQANSMANLVHRNGGKVAFRTRDELGQAHPDGMVKVWKTVECTETKWFNR